jgi:hypothetical protein
MDETSFTIENKDLRTRSLTSRWDGSTTQRGSNLHKKASRFLANDPTYPKATPYIVEIDRFWQDHAWVYAGYNANYSIAIAYEG